MLLTILRCTLFVILFLACAIVVARLVFPAPSHTNRKSTIALQPAEHGALAEALIQRGDRHEGLTGIMPLQNGLDAFISRISLANAAVSSIDAQYYIWRADLTGHLLLKALHRAAERGVRVRLLLDDNGIEGLDDTLAALDDHPSIEVRIYNPFTLRRFKWLSEPPREFRRLFRLSHAAMAGSSSMA